MGPHREFNPYAYRLNQAEEKLRRLDAKMEYHRRNDMPGTYVTGSSGVPARRLRKIEAQLERTIDMAVAWRKLTERVNSLTRKADAWDRGEIDNSGRRIRVTKPRRPITAVQRKAIDRHKLVEGLVSEIDYVGHVVLDTGHRVELWIDPMWDCKYQWGVGLIRVYDPAKNLKEYYAQSIQGVDLFRTVVEAIADIYGWQRYNLSVRGGIICQRPAPEDHYFHTSLVAHMVGGRFAYWKCKVCGEPLIPWEVQVGRLTKEEWLEEVTPPSGYEAMLKQLNWGPHLAPKQEQR